MSHIVTSTYRYSRRPSGRGSVALNVPAIVAIAPKTSSAKERPLPELGDGQVEGSMPPAFGQARRQRSQPQNAARRARNNAGAIAGDAPARGREGGFAG
ncbi:MAG TPA: hypothetical protein VFL55_22215 [Acetobacteraceae bacterium]|nr:hypothetical protein [Acetobacteraceae bacterium]